MSAIARGGRSQGRTLRMVRELPDEGAIVIVPTGGLRDTVSRMIRDVRGPEVARRCRVVAIRSTSDAQRCLMGQRRPIRVDHAFHDLAPIGVDDFVAHLVRGIEAMTGDHA